MIVVGHGPSLRGAKLGPRIDSERVVRLKNCAALLDNREDYGGRTDVMCASTEMAAAMLKVKCPEYWCYPKKGFYDEKAVDEFRVRAGGKVEVPLAVCNAWNEKFRAMGAGHANVSTGMAAIIIALELTSPRKLALAGFDKLRNPDIRGYQSTVPTGFNQGGSNDMGHDWQKEHELAKLLEQHFKVEFEWLP